MLADRPPPAPAKLTGSSQRDPVQDGATRGVIAGALTGILAFIQVEFDVISSDGVAALAGVVVFAAFALGGLWDRFIAPKLRVP
jgi:hypothetical protein